ncbi:hypothetical protein BX616_006064, partial [Lobosporangium transversale]
PLLYIHYPRGKLPKSIPEQMQPTLPTTIMGRLGSGHHYSPSSPGGNSEKPSSIRSNRSATSMASMRSVRSFIGTMFNNLKGNQGGHGGNGNGGANLGNGGSYPVGYSHHSHGSTSSISGYHGSRPGSGSSIGLTSSFTGMLPPSTPTGPSALSASASPSAYSNGNASPKSDSLVNGEVRTALLEISQCESPISTPTLNTAVLSGSSSANSGTTAVPSPSVASLVPSSSTELGQTIVIPTITTSTTGTTTAPATAEATPAMAASATPASNVETANSSLPESMAKVSIKEPEAAATATTTAPAPATTKNEAEDDTPAASIIVNTTNVSME